MNQCFLVLSVQSSLKMLSNFSRMSYFQSIAYSVDWQSIIILAFNLQLFEWKIWKFKFFPWKWLYFVKKKFYDFIFWYFSMCNTYRLNLTNCKQTRCYMLKELLTKPWSNLLWYSTLQFHLNYPHREVIPKQMEILPKSGS